MSKPVKERKKRPVNLDLQTIRFPITAIASILHRVTGVIMFVAVGILMCLLSLSLSSAEGFNEASAWVDNIVVKLVLWGILTALSYHIAGGIRHLIMDLGYCEELESGAKSAKIAFGITVVLSILSWGLIW
ncbi:succinate dehydrogenase cytochrome b556 subunit [Vibrio zhugei]|uniref:Succinate dehydrogenase cytochrome b556 subunit n=1 Tax=Vibrio zhugei TaxID=2479546 RepID=A0ABV7CEP8_9VIBR|nr:succinate dehydrogenase cytochrome b556 subunit [Vibrio zhugei]